MEKLPNDTEPKPSTYLDDPGGVGGEEVDPALAGPMTASMLGKLFGVPLLIIGAIVGSAVVVVLLFGSPAAIEPKSVESLVQALEASSGERSMGLLLPREKELWQTALELTMRLEHKEKEAELTEEELRTVVSRLAALIHTDLKGVERFITAGPGREDRLVVRSRRLEFLIHALGRTERPEAVSTLLQVLGSESEPYVSVAMQELGRLHQLPETRAAIGPIIEILGRSDRAETLLVACTVLSVLATGENLEAIEALRAARLAHEGEVAWSAALALARLGSTAGKSTLLDLLDREFLESGEKYTVTVGGGQIRRYPLPPDRVDGLIIAALDAAANLDEAEIWEMIRVLESDPSPAVRGKVMALLKTDN